MKKINVQGLGVAYLPEFKHEDVMNPEIGKHYIEMEIFVIKEPGEKAIYSTDYAREEGAIPIKALVSKKMMSKLR